VEEGCRRGAGGGAKASSKANAGAGGARSIRDSGKLGSWDLGFSLLLGKRG
jgi:hypothetical protein